MATPESAYTRAIEIYNDRDWDRLPEAYSDEIEWLDRRTLAYWSDFIGIDELRPWLESTIEAIPDIVLTFDVLESSDDQAVITARVRGHSAEGGGEMDLEWGEVVSVADERITRREFFDDGAAALRAWRE